MRVCPARDEKRRGTGPRPTLLEQLCVDLGYSLFPCARGGRESTASSQGPAMDTVERSVGWQSLQAGSWPVLTCSIIPPQNPFDRGRSMSVMDSHKAMTCASLSEALPMAGPRGCRPSPLNWCAGLAGGNRYTELPLPRGARLLCLCVRIATCYGLTHACFRSARRFRQWEVLPGLLLFL